MLLFPKRSSKQGVICQGNSLLVDFVITKLVDHFIYRLQIWVPPCNVCQIDGEATETMRDFIFLGSKITADLAVIAAMKLKDAYSLEEKL